MKQYEDFEATRLFCARCRQVTPVRKRLLLVLPDGEKYEYFCVKCGTAVGDKIETKKDKFSLILP